jgi:hypothetical protein
VIVGLLGVAVFNAGSGSVVEMVEWLDSSKVLYGLVRMAL